MPSIRTYRLNLIAVGDELAVELPPDLLARHALKAGDELVLFKAADEWRLALPGSQLHEQLRAGLEIMVERREVLRQLAKD